MHSRRRPRKNASAMRLVGRQLARFREAAGLTQRGLAAEFNLAEQTVASIEQGRRPLKPDLAARFDDRLDTKGALSVAVDNMPEVDLIPAWAEEYMDLEREALALSWYDNQVVPGLLQTERYARGVFRSRVPAFSADDIETQITNRVRRQEILTRTHPPTISFVMWEAILMDRIGGDEVYEDQLRHLRACAELPGVSLQVMPFGRTNHAGLDGPFTMLETPDHQLLGYTESQRGSQLVSDPDEVSILSCKYAMLRAQALNPEETKGLLDRLLGER
ncbi:MULTISPECIES: helix-turn-helix transcriptional regulator [unclassified Streptomyces]|uniref:helix-turn-helix domain-containing protein n=1 Tax=unclassified Streptomyces TaxID=2593676 RepID=UPI00333493FE